MDADHGAKIFTGETDGYVYTRWANPTTDVFETKIARLEHCEDAAAFASGLASEFAMILTMAQEGDNIIADDVLYGGTHGMLKADVPRTGIEVRRCNTAEVSSIELLMDDKTRLVFVETPANPTMKVVDIETVAGICRKRGIPLCVDSTFATPYLQNPADLGADLVLHSATKYISGHGDVVAGVVAGPAQIIDQIKLKRRATGACLGPFESWLLLRGLKTLGVRVKKSCENAMEIAKFLSRHPKVENVHYPGLPDHPGHELAKRQMSDFGAMLSFEIKGGVAAGKVVMDNVKICTLAVSLGDCDTLIQHPASMTHSSYTPAELAEAHITPGMIRLSLGIEDAADIIADLEQCFDKV